MATLTSPEQITVLLRRWSTGDDHALDDLIPLVYVHLRDLARSLLRAERPGHLLQATALVNEAYLRLLSQGANNWQNRSQFFAIASRVMRNILVDYARQHRSKKRGGGALIYPLETAIIPSPNQSADLLCLDDALNRLALKNARQSRIVEMHSFGGLSLTEIAELLDISENTAQRDWKFAKAWLNRELGSQKQQPDR